RATRGLLEAGHLLEGERLVEGEDVLGGGVLQQRVLAHRLLVGPTGQQLDGHELLVTGPLRAPHGGGATAADAPGEAVAGDLRRDLVHAHPRWPSRRGGAPGCPQARRRVHHMRFEALGFAPDTVDYLTAWEYQKKVHAAV